MKRPPGLLAASLLFWGWHADMLIFVVPMAVILEGSRFVKWRWEFSLTDFQRVADICSLLFIGILIYQFVMHDFLLMIFYSLRWLPFVFFPLLLTQIYSTSDVIDLRVLFLSLRRKRKIGETQALININLTYSYVGVCLLSACMVNVRTRTFYVELLFISLWALWTVRSKRYSPIIWGCVMGIIMIAGYMGQKQIYQLQQRLEQSEFLLRWIPGIHLQDADPYQTRTAIGDIGTLKLSAQALFRVKSDSIISTPLLLREASYTTYRESSWYAVRSDFSGLNPEIDRTTWKLQTATPQPSRRLTVAARFKKGNGLLKLPTGTFQLENLLVGILLRNQFGVVKVQEGPDLLTYHAIFGQQGALDSPPGEYDLSIPEDERSVFRDLADELGLPAESPGETLRKISVFLQEHFSYSLSLEQSADELPPLSEFLLNSRSGHCEYFATATVFLLRAAGLPARYAVGYSIDGLDKPGSWRLVRGRDAHAWTLLYLNGAWYDIDTTPPIWRSIEEQNASPFEWLSDIWSQWMFAFSEWRQKESTEALLLYSTFLVIPFALFLIWRLYRKKRPTRIVKRQQIAPEKTLRHPGEDSEFYLLLQRFYELGIERSPWEPLSQWLRRIEHRHVSLSFETVSSLLTLHYRYRFDPEGLSSDERMKLRSQTRVLLQQIENVSNDNPIG